MQRMATHTPFPLPKAGAGDRAHAADAGGREHRQPSRPPVRIDARARRAIVGAGPAKYWRQHLRRMHAVVRVSWLRYRLAPEGGRPLLDTGGAPKRPLFWRWIARFIRAMPRPCRDSFWREASALTEVASAGDAGEDFRKLCIQLPAVLPASARWWEAFDGYGATPESPAQAIDRSWTERCSRSSPAPSSNPATAEETALLAQKIPAGIGTASDY